MMSSAVVTATFMFLSLFLLAALSASSSPTSVFLSDDIFIPQPTLGWKKSCRVNFEFKNYTIITSRCKGPQYPRNHCCSAFKDYACPWADYLNDLSNDCSSIMISYINLFGRYPPGLFASLCKEGILGMQCRPALPPSEEVNANSSRIQISIPFVPSGKVFLHWLGTIQEKVVKRSFQRVSRTLVGVSSN